MGGGEGVNLSSSSTCLFAECRVPYSTVVGRCLPDLHVLSHPHPCNHCVVTPEFQCRSQAPSWPSGGRHPLKWGRGTTWGGEGGVRGWVVWVWVWGEGGGRGVLDGGGVTRRVGGPGTQLGSTVTGGEEGMGGRSTGPGGGWVGGGGVKGRRGGGGGVVTLHAHTVSTHQWHHPPIAGGLVIITGSDGP